MWRRRGERGLQNSEPAVQHKASISVVATAEGRIEITVVGMRGVGNLPSAAPQIVNAFPKLQVPPNCGGSRSRAAKTASSTPSVTAVSDPC